MTHRNFRKSTNDVSGYLKFVIGNCYRHGFIQARTLEKLFIQPLNISLINSEDEISLYNLHPITNGPPRRFLSSTLMLNSGLAHAVRPKLELTPLDL
jgi:hypothetical protein